MNEKSKSFNSIFFNNEYKALKGAKNTVVKRLVTLLVFTLTALGLAVGGLQQLKERMDNPFTNWVDLDISPSVEKELSAIKQHFHSSDTLKKYSLEGIDDWNRYHMAFNHRTFNPITDRGDTLSFIRMGRTIDVENQLFKEIMKSADGNVQYRNDNAFDEMGQLQSSCGVVVTEALMKKLGYTHSEYSKVKNLCVNLRQGQKVVFLELLAVVEQLPSLCHFITTNQVYGITQGQYGDFIISNSFSDSTKIRLIGTRKNQRESLKKQIVANLSVSDFDISEESIKVDEQRTFFTYIISMLPGLAPSSQQVRMFVDKCKKEQMFNDYSYLQCGEDAQKIAYPHYLSFNFSESNHIRLFQSTLYEDHDIELKMEQVKSRENFHLVSRLTSILGTVLFFLGLASILLYLGNLVQSHIQRIKPNIGTLKAMGLSNFKLKDVYAQIILRLLFLSLVVAIPIVLLFGWIVGAVWLKIGFSLFHWSIPLALVLILMIVYWLIQEIIDEVLKETPGNLIYERETDNRL